MRRSLLLSTAILALCLLNSGCDKGITAAEVAESYGIINRYGYDEEVSELIENGQADYMVANGHCRVRNTVKEQATRFGTRRVLVTEYIIDGEPYRIEVRRAVNPMRNIAAERLHYAVASQNSSENVINGLSLLSVYDTIKDHSFEATPVVAYRAWRDANGKVHPVRVLEADKLDWDVSGRDVNLIVRTADWPVTTMWFRGLASDGRREDPHRGAQPDSMDHARCCLASGGKNADAQFHTAGGYDHANQHMAAHDYRWIMESAGPGVQGLRTDVDGRTCFVNLELWDALDLDPADI
jgi:hypothetical protein